MIKYFDLTTECYPISCKQYYPDDGAVECVVLGVHGFAGDKESTALEKLAEALVRAKAALICFDLPGHGQSVVDGGSFSVENCAADVRFMLKYCADSWPDAKRCVFATSYGAYLTLLCNDALAEGGCQSVNAVLRAPAVTMPERFLSLIGVDSDEDFRRSGKKECGFERKITVRYDFYRELLERDVFKTDYVCKDFLIIHGGRDDVIPFRDAERFIAEMDRRYGKDGHGFRLYGIPAADHRFKGEGEIEEVVRAAMEYWGLV